MENPSSNMSDRMVNFGFAFNDTDFSDRVLCVEIVSEDPFVSNSDLGGGNSVANRKRQRENFDNEYGSDCCTVVKVETFRISSLVLAANSPFFLKLFKNGMRESKQSHVTLRIDASEELALVELLNYIYSKPLSVTSVPDLLKVLTIADKFEVTSCMNYCCDRLQKLPMTLEYALMYLEIPSSILTAEALKDSAKRYLAELFCSKNFIKTCNQMMALPLSVLEDVLVSDGLQVIAEDSVFDFILKWSRANYPELKERREILTKRLACLICWKRMNCSKLKQALACPDFDHEVVSKLVLEALFSKVEVPYGQQHIQASKDLATTKCMLSRRVYMHHLIKVVNYMLSRRVYMHHLIKVVNFESPRPRCVVYFDLNKDECEKLMQSRQMIVSQVIYIGGRLFVLLAECHRDQQRSSDHFGLSIGMWENSATCRINCEFQVMKKSEEEFERKYKVTNHLLKGGERVGKRNNLLGISWTTFMSKDSKYFIDDILHLRAEFSLKNSVA